MSRIIAGVVLMITDVVTSVLAVVAAQASDSVGVLICVGLIGCLISMRRLEMAMGETRYSDDVDRCEERQ